MRLRRECRRIQEREMSEASKLNSISWILNIPTEIWDLVGQWIHNLDTLRALVSTCRDLRDIYTPLLYQNRTIRLTGLNTRDLMAKPLPPGLEHTRDFDVFIPEFSEDYTKYEKSSDRAYIFYLTRCLRAIPKHRLRSFRWTDNSFENSYNPTLMLHDKYFLEVLKSAAIRKIHILFASQYLEDREAARVCFIPLCGFRNLTSLELFNFYGNHYLLARDLARTLAASPTLKILRLGLAHDVNHSFSLLIDSKNNFLEELCIEFSKHPVGSLELQTLGLGWGMWLWQANKSSDAKYLGKLCDVSKLQALQLHNGLVNESNAFAVDEDFAFVDWTHLAACKSMRQVSVTTLTYDCVNWIEACGTVKELLVMDDANFESPNASYLRRLDLTMLHIRDWMGPRTALDALPNRGDKIERLSISLDFQQHWTKFTTRLKHMPRLTQLRIDPEGRYYSNEERSPERVQNSIDVAKQYVSLMRQICPDLVYVCIDTDAWQILPKARNFVKSVSMVEIRRMNWDEKMRIDLFALEKPHLSTDCGLPSLARNYEQLWGKESCEWVDRYCVQPLKINKERLVLGVT